jgi:hypothetical protein
MTNFRFGWESFRLSTGCASIAARRSAKSSDVRTAVAKVARAEGNG